MMGSTPDILTLNGHVGGLAAVHLAPDHSLGVLDRDAPLGVGHQDDEGDDQQEDDDHDR